MHAIIVEPDTILGQTYVAALRAHGWTAVHAPHGQAAIESVDAQFPDVLVMDIQLPGINGLGFLQEFRSYHDLSEVPIIINTFTRPQETLYVKEVMRRDFAIATWLDKSQTSLERFVAAVKEHGGQQCLEPAS